jgi:hypothetical protein
MLTIKGYDPEKICLLFAKGDIFFLAAAAYNVSSHLQGSPA